MKLFNRMFYIVHNPITGSQKRAEIKTKSTWLPGKPSGGEVTNCAIYIIEWNGWSD